MDYFQGVVTEYLVADRSMFVNSELLIKIDDKPMKGRHWYCDAAAVSFRDRTLYLCEVTYSKSMDALSKRLHAWGSHWPEVQKSVRDDCHVPQGWKVTPWVFIPKQYHHSLMDRIAMLSDKKQGLLSMTALRITYLEDVVPWSYDNENRREARYISASIGEMVSD